MRYVFSDEWHQAWKNEHPSDDLEWDDVISNASTCFLMAAIEEERISNLQSLYSVLPHRGVVFCMKLEYSPCISNGHTMAFIHFMIYVFVLNVYQMQIIQSRCETIS